MTDTNHNNDLKAWRVTRSVEDHPVYQYAVRNAGSLRLSSEELLRYKQVIQEWIDSGELD